VKCEMGNFYNSFLLYTKYNTVLQTGKLLVPGTAAIYTGPVPGYYVLNLIEDHHSSWPLDQ